tara:strand:+ start:348 stop:632 length:285 start_codon:yes stop_codon:yes gene_type:complete
MPSVVFAFGDTSKEVDLKDINSVDDVASNMKEVIQTEYSVTWHVDDVLSERPDLTIEQASDVLDKLCSPDNHDATIGVNWDSIKYMAEHLYPTD